MMEITPRENTSKLESSAATKRGENATTPKATPTSRPMTANGVIPQARARTTSLPKSDGMALLAQARAQAKNTRSAALPTTR